jgi:hypothetical protein
LKVGFGQENLPQFHSLLGLCPLGSAFASVCHGVSRIFILVYQELHWTLKIHQHRYARSWQRIRVARSLLLFNLSYDLAMESC